MLFTPITIRLDLYSGGLPTGGEMWSCYIDHSIAGAVSDLNSYTF